MEHIYIILNGVKDQFDNIIVVMHASQNPYDITSVSYVLLDAEDRQCDILFDASLSANVAVNLFSTENHGNS